jgi:CDP-glucose 4,6-dehydratase
VLLTGHTGFKGSWLALWLADLGAEVTGYALAPETTPALFERAGVAGCCRSILGDVRDAARVAALVREVQPDFVFHLAAQALVRRGYQEPLETFATNAVGTAAVLDAVRVAGRPCAVVVVTTDKCYENLDSGEAFREDHRLGGRDPYAASKACAELVAASYRQSFFEPGALGQHGVALATARAGNVIGGGDWSQDRIVVDAVAALAAGRPIPVRNPHAVRPWEHVLEPLSGYLELGARLAGSQAAEYCEAWNFGPEPSGACTVRELVERLVSRWGEGRWEDRSDPGAPHEARFLRLAIDKARVRLGWRPRLDLDTAVAWTVDWYKAAHRGADAAELRSLSQAQCRDHLERRPAGEAATESEDT